VIKLTMVRRNLIVLGAAAWCCFVSPTFAQDAVPAEILSRTVLMKAGDTVGTAFAIDYEGLLYLVTARHVVAGLPETKAIIQVHGPTDG
jgi:hypothetical protein